MGKLTPYQIDALIIIERCTACVSVVATLLLFTTFVFIKQFRTLSNTLIFYASFANLFANVAALIGGSALSRTSSGLCQFQGFLLEMFMQSDPMWSCAMAVNVYLVFFRRFDATRLKKLYWLYALLCYGLPFIPAMFCLFYKTKAKGKMYGNATLWCWIDNDWAPVRIYSYYAPIWIAILATFIIYLRVGVEIYQKRAQLRAAAQAPGDYGTGTIDSCPDRHTAIPITGIRTTEIKVTTDPWSNGALGVPSHAYSRSEKADQYSITITSANTRASPYPQPALSSSPKYMQKQAGTSIDKIKWAYTKCAMLFAVSILITWVPASVNRVYGLRYPNNPSFVLNIGSALVLPLQGFWNTVIYFVTSLGICRSVWAGWTEKRQSRKRWAGDIVHLRGRRENNGGWARADEGAKIPLGKSTPRDGDSEFELRGSYSERSTGEPF